MLVTRTPESLETGHCEYDLERDFTEAELNTFCAMGWQEFCQYEPHSRELLCIEGVQESDEDMTAVLYWVRGL